MEVEVVIIGQSKNGEFWDRRHKTWIIHHSDPNLVLNENWEYFHPCQLCCWGLSNGDDIYNLNIDVISDLFLRHSEHSQMTPNLNRYRYLIIFYQFWQSMMSSVTSPMTSFSKIKQQLAYSVVEAMKIKPWKEHLMLDLTPLC